MLSAFLKPGALLMEIFRHPTEPIVPKEAASTFGHTDSAGIVELIYAASEGDLPAILRLVARGIDLDGADYDYRTPLHLAAAEGHEHVVPVLY